MGRASSLVLFAACNSPAVHDAPGPAWQLADNGRAPLPLARIEPGVAAFGDQLVVVGGFDLIGGYETRVDVFDTLCTNDPPSSCWNRNPLPDVPIALTHIQLAAIGTTIYMLGGLEGAQFTARGDSYKLETLPVPGEDLKWQQIASMPTSPTDLSRGSAAIVVVPPRIYLFGGASTSTALASNIYYDTQMDAWCPGAACDPNGPLPDLPEGRSHPAAIRRNDGGFVVVGGLATLLADSPRDNVWTLLPKVTTRPYVWETSAHPMPTARGGCAYGSLQGRLVCAGGEAGAVGAPALGVTEIYDPNDDIADSMRAPWTTWDSMPSPRAGTQGAVIGQRLFVPGGAPVLAYQPSDSLWVFSPLDTMARD